MKANDRKALYFRPRVSIKGEYGDYADSYEVAYIVFGTARPASGRLLLEMYGERVKYMLRIICDATVQVKEADGLCYIAEPTEKPDYKVIAVNNWPRHKEIIVEVI